MARGEDDRVLRAVQTVVDERLAMPVLVGRGDVIAARILALGLRLRPGVDVEILDPARDQGIFGPLATRYQGLVGRRGAPPDAALRRVERRPTVAAAMLLESGYVDAALCGGSGDWWRHMTYVMPIIPRRLGIDRIHALSALITRGGVLFICDTHMNPDPSAEQIAEMTRLAADAVREFGLEPKAALLSHSSFGASNSPSARKMRQALALLRLQAPDLEVDGEMHADAAMLEGLRHRLVGDSTLRGAANLLVMPNLDAANISMTLLQASTGALLVGPLLLGMSKPIHVLTPSVTARGIVNLTALAAAARQISS